MTSTGKLIVLAASTSESTEYRHIPRRMQPRYAVPNAVDIPEERRRPELPVLS